MNVFLRVDINIVAMILLGIIAMIAYKRLDLKDQLNRAFLITSLIVILELFFETSTCVLNRRPELWAAPVSTILHFFLFVAGPILTYSWYRMVLSLDNSGGTPDEAEKHYHADSGSSQLNFDITDTAIWISVLYRQFQCLSSRAAVFSISSDRIFLSDLFFCANVYQ